MNKHFETLVYKYKLKKYGVWYDVFERFILSYYWYNRERTSWIVAPKLKQTELTIHFDDIEQLKDKKSYYDDLFNQVNILLERFYENVKDIKKLDIWVGDDDEQDDEDDMEGIE